jgi:peptidyl-tRNA hydrolase
VLGAVIGSSLVGGCATAKRITPKIVKIGADECVEVANDEGTKKVCATMSDLVPLLEEILSAQQARIAKEKADAAGSAEPPADEAAPTE